MEVNDYERNALSGNVPSVLHFLMIILLRAVNTANSMDAIGMARVGSGTEDTLSVSVPSVMSSLLPTPKGQKAATAPSRPVVYTPSLVGKLVAKMLYR
jgi:hypothetical protein